MTDDQDEITAYHEAGHVVMAVKTGGRIVRASIAPPWDDEIERYGETITVWNSLSAPEIYRYEIAVSLAGPVAEMIFNNEEVEVKVVAEWQADWSRAMISALQLAKDEAQAMILLNRGTDSIRQFMNSDAGWAAVASVADLLLAHETVEHEQCLEAVGFWLPD
jgi:hypothetical protein